MKKRRTRLTRAEKIALSRSSPEGRDRFLGDDRRSTPMLSGTRMRPTHEGDGEHQRPPGEMPERGDLVDMFRQKGWMR